jgi:4-amino-4-deoxy-L-arabinose transferase-like glycosyltransferase
MKRFALLFALALAILCLKVTFGSVGAGYVDPIGQIRSQDEAVYSHTAIRMATKGDWLTPYFLERFALYKPPLFYWLTAFCVKLFGISVISLRLASVLAGAAMVALLAARTKTWIAALVLVTLAGNEYLARLSGLALTDALLTGLFIFAMDALRQDETLASKRSALVFGALTGLAIMTKGIAGLLPLIALGAHQGIRLLRRQPIADWRRLLLVGTVAFAVAAPWHLYQWAVHPRWFLAEYVGVEIMRYGLGTPPQTSQESTAMFYGWRFLRLEPLLVVLGMAALVRQRSAVPLAIVITVVAAVFGYQYRNLSYWLPLIPAFAIVIGEFVDEHPRFALLVPVAFLSLLTPSELRRSADPPLAAVATLRQYCQMPRANELYVLGTPDEFHATVLPLGRRVHYIFIAPRPEYGTSALDFHALGITQTVDEALANTPSLDDVNAWGVRDGQVRGTVILARDSDDLHRFVAARPTADFLLPEGLKLGGRIQAPAPTLSCAL